jgi:glucokinase
MANRLIISADIGGSHISAAVFTEMVEGFAMGAIQMKSVDSSQQKDFILSEWVSVFKGLTIDFSSACIILAMLAPFDYINGYLSNKRSGEIHPFIWC